MLRFENMVTEPQWLQLNEKNMKKRFFAFIMAVITMVSCDVAKEFSGLTSLVNCKYSYNSISNLSVSGMNVNNGLSLTSVAAVTSILTGTANSIPLNFTLNLNVDNPNQSTAMLRGMQYIVSIDGIQFTTGSMNQTLSIASGQRQVLPLTIGVDLATLMKNNSKDAVVDIAKNIIGIGSKESTVSLQIKPSFMVNNSVMTSPVYIPVSFTFGGSK